MLILNLFFPQTTSLVLRRGIMQPIGNTYTDEIGNFVKKDLFK